METILRAIGDKTSPIEQLKQYSVSRELMLLPMIDC